MSNSKDTQYASDLALVVSLADAAEYLGLTTARVKVLRAEGRLASKRIGRDWAIARRSLERFAQQDRPAHRPPAARKNKRKK